MLITSLPVAQPAAASDAAESETAASSSTMPTPTCRLPELGRLEAIIWGEKGPEMELETDEDDESKGKGKEKCCANDASEPIATLEMQPGKPESGERRPRIEGHILAFGANGKFRIVRIQTVPKDKKEKEKEESDDASVTSEEAERVLFDELTKSDFLNVNHGESSGAWREMMMAPFMSADEKSGSSSASLQEHLQTLQEILSYMRPPPVTIRPMPHLRPFNNTSIESFRPCVFFFSLRLSKLTMMAFHNQDAGPVLRGLPRAHL